MFRLIKTHNKNRSSAMLIVCTFISKHKKWARLRTMVDSTIDWELSRGMIGACVSKLRVVSWITIDWQNSQPPHAYRKWVGNGAKQQDPRFRPPSLDHKAHRKYCTRQNARVLDLTTYVRVYIYTRRARLCVSRVGSRRAWAAGLYRHWCLN